ncbi:MAG: hypothetical protein AB7U75_19960 [Hyphomicrobiaceae bacterium]
MIVLAAADSGSEWWVASIWIPTLLSGVVSGVVVAFFHHYFVWRKQRNVEARQSVFDAAVAALAMYEADTMNVKLQSDKPSAGSVTPETNLRDETKIAMSKALALVPVFFSKAASDAFKAAFSSRLGLKNIPNPDYYTAVERAKSLLANEIDP